MSDTVSFTLSKPFSANRMYNTRRLRSGHINLSTDYRKWRDREGWLVKTQLVGCPQIACRYEMRVVLPPTRMADDNPIKPIGDLMQHIHLITNDRNMHGHTVEHDPTRSDVLVVLTLRPDLPPRTAVARKPSYRTADGNKPTVGQIGKARRAGAWKVP